MFSDQFMNNMTTTFYNDIGNDKRCKNTICTPFTATCQSGFADPHTSISWKIQDSDAGVIDVTNPSRIDKICEGEMCSTISTLVIREGDEDEVIMVGDVLYVVDKNSYQLECTIAQAFTGATADVKQTKDGKLYFS